MDFASAPLQALLMQNAGEDQLTSYIEQLDRRFCETAIDEKDRFGALQLLLPTLKAHLARLPSLQEKEKVLETYIPRLVKASFAHDSMVATESVSLLSDAVAYWMTRSLLGLEYLKDDDDEEGEDDGVKEETFSHGTDDDEPDNICRFGRNTMILLLGQLVWVTESEPDFVDLQPLQFIKVCLEGDRPEWLAVHEYTSTLRKKHDPRPKTRINILQDEDLVEDDAVSMISSNTFHTTRTTTSSSNETLDLLCCVDTLNRFVLEVPSSSGDDDLPDSKQKELHNWIDVISAVAIAMLPCTDAQVRAKLANELIPNTFRLRQKYMSGTSDDALMEEHKHWSKMLWTRTVQIFELPATNLLRLETYGLIAKFFDLYFGLDQNEKPVIYLDLRFDEQFFKILQSGLRNDDALYRKYSAYIMKRVVDFTSKSPELGTISGQTTWTRYFEWSSTKSQDYSDLWADWFLLYEIMHEPVLHLVTPVLPRFEMLLTNQKISLDASWWILLFYRGFQNDTTSVKKGILEYVFGIQNPTCLNALGVQRDFIFGALLKAIDVTNLYSVPTRGTLVSPFGEKLKAFMINLINSIKDTEERVYLLRQLIHHLAHVVNSYVPILYIMEALVDVNSVPAWNSDELKSLRYLIDRHRNIQLSTTKLYLRKLAISATVKYANTCQLSFSDVAKTVSSLITDFPIQPDTEHYQMLRGWLEQNVSADRTMEVVLKSLKERTDAYANATVTDEDTPTSTLRNQANVLARMSIFVAADKEGHTQRESLELLFGSVSKKLQSSTCSPALFNWLLVLVDAAWEMFDVCWSGCNNFASLIKFSETEALAKIEGQFLNMDKDNVTDDNTVELFLSIMSRILKSSTTIESATREMLIMKYHKICRELLDPKDQTISANREMSKIGHLRLLSIVYEAALQHGLFELKCNDSIVGRICKLQTKKTPEALRLRKWGETLSTFIRYKWECVQSIIRYASTISKQGNNKEVTLFDPVNVYNEATDQLENASELCAASVMSCAATILSLPWEKTIELVEPAVNYSIELIKENIAQSKTSPGIIRAAMSMIFQPQILSNPSLNEDDGPIKRALYYILSIGEFKPFVVTQCVTQLHEFWSTFTEEANLSMLQYATEIAKLLVYGPLRERDDQKLEAAISLKLQSPAAIVEAEDTAAMVFNQNDYVARVMMNDLLLRLKKDVPHHVTLAKTLIDILLNESAQDKYYESQYLGTIEHRVKIRIWCSSLLLDEFIPETDADKYIDLVLQNIQKETVVSVRCYMEWMMMRLFWRFPSKIHVLYKLLQNAEIKPHFAISLLTITLPLGDILDDTSAASYFEEIFALIIPWLSSNHFTVRLYSYSAWFRNLASCRRRGLNPDIEKNRYMESLVRFMDQYAETIKYWDKVKSQFYIMDFDPVKDYNIEFIFRQMMTVFGVVDNEKIGSRAFIKVNPEPVDRCPFMNPTRNVVYTCADPSELMGFPEQQNDQPAEIDHTGNRLEEISYQKKIMPWEMMLETDVELTKSLVQKKRRRNDLIVVASLVDRIPNLAGLCRTCEIFNAAQLAVYSLKIKDDPGFLSISVASEKWMPMIEVGESDIPAFLQAKKEEGYVLCGLEQTTTSAKLGEFEFPERCVLLLGDEKQGIPANLLQMLDQTIEIPQQGITRSLNVHVSGAICIYEYTKQMQWRQHMPSVQPHVSSPPP